MKKALLTFAAFLVVKELTQEKFDELEETKKVELYAEYNTALKTSFEEVITEVTETTATKQELEDAIKTGDVEAVKQLVTKLEGEFNAWKEEAKESGPEKATLVKEIESNMDTIKALAGRTGTAKELVLKADTLTTSITNNNQNVEVPGIGQLATRRLSMYDLFRKIPVSPGNHNGTIQYYDWDEATTVRAAALVAEGVAFPESEAKWQGYTLTLKKIGDTLPVSAEFYEDAQMFAAELNAFLDINVKLVIDNQICNGTGGTQLTGLFQSVPAFNSALVSTVPNATFYDLLAVSTEQITVTGGAKYQPNFVVMRKSMINQLRLTKDANENYIIPPFVSRDGKEVDSMMVVESNIVPDNQLVLGDSNFARIYEMGGVTLSRGTVDTQFTEDMETLKARKRIAFLIRTVDQTGFIKIEDVTAAIAAITAT